MRLYHGSNVAVRAPRIFITNRLLDFGAGFYMTSSQKQAETWSKIQTARRRIGVPTVSIFDFDDGKLSNLDVLHFDGPNREWLHFIVANRKGIYTGNKYDLVIGPVANDNTMSVIGDYMSGLIDEERALLYLMPQKLVDQYAFLTWRALNTLTFTETIQHE